jgi:endoglucanase
MAKRYRSRPQVVVAELRNEIRPDPNQHLTPTRGDGNPATDAVHDYTWDHPVGHLADDAAFAADETVGWGFVAEPGHSWTAPVYVSEWGGCTQPKADGTACTQDRLAYPYAMARYLEKSDLDWAWWPINATQSAGYNRTRGRRRDVRAAEPGLDGVRQSGPAGHAARHPAVHGVSVGRYGRRRPNESGLR